jgi:hypothetical protein
MNTNEVPENYIFFLQLEDDLPEIFCHLAHHLSKKNISLIPVRIQDFDDLAKLRRNYLISIAPDMASAKILHRFKKKILDHSIMTGRVCLFEGTSFNKTPIIRKSTKERSYFCFQLPILFEDICNEIAKVYYKEKKMFAKWPGGRRVTLPPV